MSIFLLLFALSTSVIGSICGVGGGVIIKPVLDAMNIMSVSAISFLSGCTVFVMSLYNVSRSFQERSGIYAQPVAAEDRRP